MLSQAGRPKRSIPGARPNFGKRIDAILEDIRSALETGKLTQAEHLEKFEQAFSRYLGSTYASGVNSGGSALELVLKALRINGCEVLVPTNTFVATANAVSLAGGRPVFADIEESTLCVCPDDVMRRLTPKTAGIIAVHMFGLVPPGIESIRDLCKEKGIFLIEDAAHAPGASYDGRMAGTFGDAGCFSFYATKVITTGEGGMITTNRKDLHERILQLRNHGRSLHEGVYELTSNNYRLAELPAILGRYQLMDLDENLRSRNEIARIYRSRLHDVPGLRLLPEFPKARNSYWRFPAYVDDRVNRKTVQQRMADDHGIRINWMYDPLCHLQPVFRKSHGHRETDFPVAERCMKRLICLPCYPGISDEDASALCDALIDSLSSASERSRER